MYFCMFQCVSAGRLCALETYLRLQLPECTYLQMSVCVCVRVCEQAYSKTVTMEEVLHLTFTADADMD